MKENNDLSNKIDFLDKEHRELLANLSHDLRTPLTSLIGYIELFDQNDDNKEEYLEILSRRSKSLKDLIEKFYQFSIMSSYEINEVEKVNLIDLLIRNILNYYDLFDQIGQSIDIDKNIDKYEMILDVKLFELIIHNVLDNMLKYSNGDNKIKILEEKNYLTLIFSNSTALPDGNYDFLFERMKVIDNTRKNSTGLGLSILKSAADKLGFETNIKVKDNIFSLYIKIRK